MRSVSASAAKTLNEGNPTEQACGMAIIIIEKIFSLSPSLLPR